MPSAGTERKTTIEKTVLKHTITLKFDIGGMLRFLSHQETVSLFVRALVRTAVPLAYSQGFNPRPRLSLPFPRSVGLAAEGDICCFRADCDSEAAFNVEAFKTAVASAMPDGITVVSVDIAPGAITYHPVAADYEFVLKKEIQNPQLARGIAALAGPGECLVERREPKKGAVRMINAREFVQSAQVCGNRVLVRCRITPAGAVRVNEIMKLLEIEQPMLDGQILRRNVNWQRSN